MDVKAAIARWGLARPHVLLVAAPADTSLRWHTEALLVRRGWPAAWSPADADLVVTLGAVGDLADAVDVLWQQVPAPRQRAHVSSADDAERVLDSAAASLLTSQAREPAEPPPAPTEHDDMGAGHDMGGDVAGLPMAGGGPDRDGLELDALTVGLGPVLPGWPTGLVVTATMAGDVLTDVRARVVGPTSSQRLDATLVALDGLERFLLVAGWTAAARDAARLRAAPDAQRVGDLARRVRRSRTLRWSAGDLRGSYERVLGWCDRLDTGPGTPSHPESPVARGGASPVAVAPGDLATLLDGLDLGSARLVVASLDQDLAGARTGGRRG